MRQELDALLCERYPLIFADRNRSIYESCMGRGFSCDDGWFNLIDTLCECLQSRTDHNKDPQIVAAQVKEKWGELCFYPNLASGEQRGMIAMARAMSTRVCEKCGAPGQLHVSGGTYLTRCSEHVPPGAIPSAEHEALRRTGA